MVILLRTLSLLVHRRRDPRQFHDPKSQAGISCIHAIAPCAESDLRQQQEPCHSQFFHTASPTIGGFISYRTAQNLRMT
jgi:hypothetical protein